MKIDTTDNSVDGIIAALAEFDCAFPGCAYISSDYEALAHSPHPPSGEDGHPWYHGNAFCHEYQPKEGRTDG